VLNMLWVVASVLVALWVVAVATSHTMGGLIYALLVLAIAAVVVRLVFGERWYRAD
jgi:hypothetical protein